MISNKLRSSNNNIVGQNWIDIAGDDYYPSKGNDEEIEGGRFGISLKNRIKAVSKGIRDDYSYPVYEFILRNYNDEIKHIEVCRRPLSNAVNKAFTLISLGKWDKEKYKYGYDTFYHLFLICFMKSGKKIVVEKNAVINVGKAPEKLSSNEKCISVPMNGRMIKLGVFMKNGESSMKNYFRYDPFTNNCQVFVYNMLKSNALLDDKLKNFILQDVEGVVSGQRTYVPTVARKITNLGGLADKFLEGETDREEIKDKLKEKGEISQEAYEGGNFLLGFI